MTSNPNAAFVMINRLVYLLPTLVILAGCVVYLGKHKSLEAVLMLAGQMVLVVGNIVSSVLIALMSGGSGAHGAVQFYMSIMSIISVFSILGGLAFAVGFIMMALKQQPPSTPAVPPPLADTAGQ